MILIYPATKYQKSLVGRNQPSVRPSDITKSKGVRIRAIIEIFLAIIFSLTIGSLGIEIKKESMTKVQKGIMPLSDFTRKLTETK